MENLINLNLFRDKTLLITGGLGFVGINLVTMLQTHGIKPIISDYILNETSLDKKYIPFDLDQMEFYNIDLTNFTAVTDMVHKVNPDYIIHLGSTTNLKKDFETAFLSVDINIKGTLNLLKSIHNTSVNCFIFMSTSDVYGGINPPFKEDQLVFPASPYSVSKVSAEMYCLLFYKVLEIPIVILRCFNLYGKFQKPNRVIPYIILNLLQKKEVKLTEGNQRREFNFIEDAIEAILLALTNAQAKGKIINIGSGESVSIRGVALNIAKQLNLVDKLNFGAIPYRPNEIWDMYCDNSRAKEILNWKSSTSLEIGLEKTIQWYKENFG